MTTKSLPMNHGRRLVPWFSGLWLAVATALWLLLGPAPESLVFDRAAIGSGEAWRLITGHLVHSDGQHALWDIGALAIIGSLMERHGKVRMALAGGTGILAVNACLLWYLPEFDRYCGLSGMLHAMFAVTLADLWLRHRHPAFPCSALVLCIKLMVEIATGQSLVLDTQWPSVPLTHLAGGLGGLVFLAVDWGIFSSRRA
jgi:rhomboid family GlyGly-CTERM serine protease